MYFLPVEVSVFPPPLLPPEGASPWGTGTSAAPSARNEGGIPVKRYSTALSGLLKLALKAATT